jgi:UDP-glucose:(heptosyl)LPS alpha-1,3-glucosyltransferase
MKVSLVIGHFDPRKGGAESWTYQFAQRLLQRGHELHVLAQTFSDAARQLPIAMHRLPTGVNRLKLAAAAETQLRSLDLDIIHDMGLGWYSDIFHSHDGSRSAQRDRKLRMLSPYLRLLKRPLQHVLPRYREFDALSARQFGERQQLFLALSWMVAHDYQHFHHVSADRIRLVYNGVDTECFSPEHRGKYREPIRRQMGVAEGETVFLFVGHDFKRKGLATAVRAVARLASAGERVRLVVVGGKRLQRDQQHTNRYRNEGPVTFVGLVDDPVPYYAAADAFVLPSFYDPCSLSVLEAAASGLPSITTHVNGAGELLTSDVNGFLLSNPEDDEQLAGQMRLLLEPVLRARMGEAAREMALDHSFERNCDQIIEIYDEVLERREHFVSRDRIRAAA